jgi:uncharacterized protein (TIGR03067 family)
MRLTIGLIALFLLAAGTQDKQPARDLNKFQGAWVLVSGEKDGEKIKEEHVQQSKITWKSKTAHLHTPHQSKEIIRADVTLDANKSPKRMSWVRTTEPGKGKVMHAIYEFQGDDQYRVCFAPPGQDAPTMFATRAGTGHILHVWKRQQE